MALTIGAWRRARNMTQDELATLCGVTRTTICNWENNPGNIKVKYVPVICEAFGITQDDIIFLPDYAN